MEDLRSLCVISSLTGPVCLCQMIVGHKIDCCNLATGCLYNLQIGLPCEDQINCLSVKTLLDLTSSLLLYLLYPICVCRSDGSCWLMLLTKYFVLLLSIVSLVHQDGLHCLTGFVLFVHTGIFGTIVALKALPSFLDNWSFDFLAVHSIGLLHDCLETHIPIRDVKRPRIIETVSV